MNKTENKKRQFIIFGLCSFLALILCMVTLVVTVKKVEKEENKGNASDKSFEDIAFMENTEENIFAYISLVTKNTQNNEAIKVNTYVDVNINDDTITVNGEKEGKDVGLFKYLKNQLMGKIDGIYGEDYIGQFGTVYDKMPLVPSLIKTNTIGNMTVGETDDEGNPVYDENGAVVDGDHYFLTFTAKGDKLTKAEKVAYGLVDLPPVEESAVEILSPICNMRALQAEPLEFTITAKVNARNNRIVYLEISRVYAVNAYFEFINEFSVFGEKSVSFEYGVTKKYDYFFAGVTLSHEEISLEKGEEAQLTVNAVMENDSEYTVKFTSSDESTVTVDEMGYVKAIGEIKEPVYITVELEYLGKSFKDQCVVYAQADES